LRRIFDLEHVATNQENPNHALTWACAMRISQQPQHLLQIFLLAQLC